MSSVQQSRGTSSEQSSQPGLCARIYGEFREMPGLTLTIPQASRLFNMDRVEIQHLMEAMVKMHLLQTDGRVYALTGAGRLCA